MSDIADIMGLKRPQQRDTLEMRSITSPKTPRPKPQTANIQEGWGSMGKRDIQLFKKKRIVSTGVRPQWKWLPFFNPGRSDDLHLHHWQRTDDVEDYQFNRFNKKVELATYTPEIYQQHLQSSEWTKEETDELWDLLRQFDLRFLVVADRMTRLRPVEDIKDRYYSIATKLLQLERPNEDLSDHPLIAFPYYREEEVKRKIENEKLYNRSKDQIEEENYLRQEIKRIESAMKKQQLLKKKKIVSSKKRDDTSGFDPTSPSFSSPLPKKDRNFDRKKVTLRSLGMVNPLSVNPKTAQRVEDTLLENGLVTFPMATLAISKEVQQLQQDIVVSIELEKHLQTQAFALQQARDQKPTVTKRSTAVDPNKGKKKKKKKD